MIKFKKEEKKNKIKKQKNDDYIILFNQKNFNINKINKFFFLSESYTFTKNYLNQQFNFNIL